MKTFALTGRFFLAAAAFSTPQARSQSKPILFACGVIAKLE